MITVSCADLTCGVQFGIPEHIETQARRNKARTVSCPNGHRFFYEETEAVRLKRQVDSLTEQLTSARAARDRNWRTATYWKGIAHRRRRS